MKIIKNENYKIQLFDEPKDIKNHDKSSSTYFSFSGNDLLNAIISAGMPDVYLTRIEKSKRRDEIAFKVKLFETFVKAIKDETGNKLKLQFDADKKMYLDSSEVAAINYWIGMILTVLLGEKNMGMIL